MKQKEIMWELNLIYITKLRKIVIKSSKRKGNTKRV